MCFLFLLRFQSCHSWETDADILVRASWFTFRTILKICVPVCHCISRAALIDYSSDANTDMTKGRILTATLPTNFIHRRTCVSESGQPVLQQLRNKTKLTDMRYFASQSALAKPSDIRTAILAQEQIKEFDSCCLNQLHS